MTPEIKKRIEDINNGVLPEGYKKTNIGIIPKEWAVVPLSKIMHNEQRPIDKPDKPYTRIGIRSHAKGTFHELVEDPSTVNMDTLYVVKKDDFIVNITFAWEHAIAVADEFDEGKLVSHRFPTYVFDNNLPLYYKYVFSQEMFRKKLELISPGGAGRNRVLNKTDFLNLGIYRPSLEEQQKITEILSTQDELISLQERKVEELKKLKKAYLSKMFPKNGSKYPELRFKGFTDAWEQRKLGDIVTVYDGVHQTPNYQTSGVMFLSVENIATLKSNKYISVEDFKRDYKVYPQKNDILMTRIGDVGTTNVVTDNDVKAYYVSLALLKYKATNPFFLSSAIQSDFVQKGLSNRTLKTAIPMKINKDEIGQVDVMLPTSADEQDKIGSFFSQLDTLITLHQRKLEVEKKKKKALMQLLLTGKVRCVND